LFAEIQQVAMHLAVVALQTLLKETDRVGVGQRLPLSLRPRTRKVLRKQEGLGIGGSQEQAQGKAHQQSPHGSSSNLSARCFPAPDPSRCRCSRSRKDRQAW